MNRFRGIITSISSEGHLSIVRIQGDDLQVTTIVVDTPASTPYLVEGNEVGVHFKEMEVVIARDYSGQISMQNKWQGTITAMEKGILLTSVSVQCGSHRIASLITTHAAQEMSLCIGDTVTAMIKTNEISIVP